MEQNKKIRSAVDILHRRYVKEDSKRIADIEIERLAALKKAVDLIDERYGTMLKKFARERRVGEESSKTYQQKIDSGFFTRYMSGYGCEPGYAGYLPNCVPILDECDGYDLKTPGYDGKTIPKPDGFYSWVYNSHTLEHISDYRQAIREWYRVTEVGGHIIIVVPHRDLYEKKLELPSRWNGDHKRFYTSSSLCKEIEDSLDINSYRVRHLRENDEGHDYNDGPDKHGRWNYEIEIVIQRIK